jgi:hypothetical protein
MVHRRDAETLRKTGKQCSPRRHGGHGENKIKVNTGERRGGRGNSECPRASVRFGAKAKSANTEVAEDTEPSGDNQKRFTAETLRKTETGIHHGDTARSHGVTKKG